MGHTFIANKADVYQRYCLSYSKFLFLPEVLRALLHMTSHAAQSKSKHTPLIAANIELTYPFTM
jgi:hypothetical protein